MTGLFLRFYFVGMKHLLQVNAATNSNEATLYLYGYVDEWGKVNVQSILNAIATLNVEVLHVRIHSNGGSVFEGNAILNALMNYKGEVRTYVDGLAASMASVIFQAGKVRTMAENAILMVHNPSIWASGDAVVMRKTADLLDKVTSNLVATYMKRSGKPEADIRKLMNETSWLTAQETVVLNFADGIAPSVMEAPQQEERAEASQNLAALIAAYIPTDTLFTAHTQSAPQNPSGNQTGGDSGAPTSNSSKTHPTDMDTKVLATKLGLPENATEAQIEAKMNELQAKADTAASLAEQQQNERINTLITAAINEKKITPAAKAHWETLAKANFDTTKATLDSMQAYTPLAGQLKEQPDPADVEAQHKASFEKLQKMYPTSAADAMAQIRNKA